MPDVQSPRFWSYLESLVSSHAAVLDRPAGTAHPRYPDLIYPYDYGYLQGTTGGDGQGIDVWAGSGDRCEITGVVCTVDVLKHDAEIKILLGCTLAEMNRIQAMHDSGAQGALLLLHPRVRVGGSALPSGEAGGQGESRRQ
jgi:inorganic pyrophosphatase